MPPLMWRPQWLAWLPTLQRSSFTCLSQSPLVFMSPWYGTATHLSPAVHSNLSPSNQSVCQPDNHCLTLFQPPHSATVFTPTPMPLVLPGATFIPRTLATSTWLQLWTTADTQRLSGCPWTALCLLSCSSVESVICFHEHELWPFALAAP